MVVLPGRIRTVSDSEVILEQPGGGRGGLGLSSLGFELLGLGVWGFRVLCIRVSGFGGLLRVLLGIYGRASAVNLLLSDPNSPVDIPNLEDHIRYLEGLGFRVYGLGFRVS